MAQTAKEFFKGLVNAAKTKIEHLVSTTLSNEEKKQALDTYIRNWATDKLKQVSINVFLKWLIEKYVIGNIEIITQLVFDLLKANVYNLTKKEVA